MLRSLFALLLLATTAGGCARSVASGEPAPELRVHRGAFARTVLLTGEIKASRGDELTVPRMPDWQNTIRWMAEEGTAVRAGDRVIEIDNSAFATSLDAKRQTVRQAEQELQQKSAEWAADTLEKKLDLEKRRAEFEKTKLDASVPAEILAGRDYAQKQIAFQRASVEFAKAADVARNQEAGVRADRGNLLLKLEAARRDLALAEAAVTSLVIRAPKAGIFVVRDHPWEGRKLREGDAVWVGFPLAQIPDMTSLQVEASLADVDDGRIRPGDPATVVLDAYPGETFRGHVSEVGAVANETSRNSLRRTLRVAVALDRIDPRMRPGFSARVAVTAAPEGNVLLAPRAALDFSAARPRARLQSGRVVDVDAGSCNAQECVVRGGLAEGDVLVPFEVPHAS